MTHNKAYREAEQKIEEAMRSRVTRLSLNPGPNASVEEKLTELPEAIWQLTQLQSLDLSYNQLTAVPETIGQLT